MPCGCEATTVAGFGPMRREIKMNLGPISGVIRTVKSHVMDWGPPMYQVILGADTLRPLGARMTAGSGEWRVRLGKTRYRSVKLVTKGEYVWAAVVRSPDVVTPKIYDGAGVVPMRGEMKLNLEPNSGVKRTVKAHVMDWGPPMYQVILGADALRPLGAWVTEGSDEWRVSPLWVVPKPPAADGTPRYRVVVDFRELNKRIRTERYPLPRMEDMLDRMHGAKVFSIVDLKSGYHQIRMHPGDVKKTAFQFERGKYGWVQALTHLRELAESGPNLEVREPEGLRYLREWTESGPDLPPTKPGPSAGTEQMSPGEEVGQLSWSHAIVNNKPRQVILKTGTGQGVTVTHSRYARTRTWTVTAVSLASDDNVLTAMTTFLQNDVTYYVYADRVQDRERLNRLYATGRLGSTR
ncbi:hypothetical protein AAG570_008404 [Ranatra chinensis]|uniref:Reverse transcriptase domain-containing protein n=1 Tax=Ranatra chinensis TaxID=642074 RepID=A0ABD0YR36_9HEMI